MNRPIRPGIFPILAVVGPTATGKTAFALDLARVLGAEVISADSMQVYRYMDIGTAKPPREIRQEIPHHFIDILDPDEGYSAGLYARQARSLISEKVKKGIPLVIVGGTGLYVKALEKGLVDVPPISKGIEKGLWEAFVTNGLEYLYERLRRVDPVTASRVHPHDRFRILRALGIYETTKRPLSFFHRSHGFGEKPLPLFKIGLTYSREVLYERIEKRVDRMMEEGWMEEVSALLKKGYDETLRPMQAIGYKQLVSVLKGRMETEDAVREIKKETRRLAKRQHTWFKKERPHLWLNFGGGSGEKEAERLIEQIQRGELEWMPKKG